MMYFEETLIYNNYCCYIKYNLLSADNNFRAITFYSIIFSITETRVHLKLLKLLVIVFFVIYKSLYILCYLLKANVLINKNKFFRNILSSVVRVLFVIYHNCSNMK